MSPVTDRELLELIAAQVSSLTTQVGKLTSDMAEVKNDLAGVKADLRFTRETVVKIEIDHGQKLGALLNGYKLHEERLDRHEEIISKKY